jgi:hypothetical protein
MVLTQKLLQVKKEMSRDLWLISHKLKYPLLNSKAVEAKSASSSYGGNLKMDLGLVAYSQ